MKHKCVETAGNYFKRPEDHAVGFFQARKSESLSHSGGDEERGTRVGQQTFCVCAHAQAELGETRSVCNEYYTSSCPCSSLAPFNTGSIVTKDTASSGCCCFTTLGR